MRVSAAPLRFVAVALLTLWGLAIVGFFLSSSSRTDFDVRDMRYIDTKICFKNQKCILRK